MQRLDPVDQQPPAGLTGWARVLASAGTATLTGALAAPIAFAVGLLAKDPIDVVGRPLVDGYSERAESIQWIVFLAATAILTAWFIRRLPLSWASWIAALTVVPPVLALWQSTWLGLALYIAVAVAIFAFARRSSLGIGFIVWLGAYPWITWDAPVALILTTPLALTATVASFATNALLQNSVRIVAASAVALLVAVGGWEQATIFAVGAAVMFLGARCRSDRSPFLQGPWLKACLLLAVPCIWIALKNDPTGVQAGLLLAAGAGWGMMARSVRLPIPSTPPVSWMTAAALIVVAFAAWQRPYCIVVLVPGLFIAVWSRPSWRAAMIVAALLPIAFLSAGPIPREFDPFHDGQILAAVMEFDAGKRLYSEVFPLRSYEFYLACIAERFLAPGGPACWWLEHALQFLPLAGAFLSAFAWTRSLSWSLAAALILVVRFPQDGRMGWHFWLATSALAMLRTGTKTSIVAWMFAGVWAAACGYDLLVPFAVASMAAVAVSKADWRRLLGAALLLVLPWSILLLGWQGFASVKTYWALLFDYARNYPAVYGLPIPWSDLYYWSAIMVPLVVGVFWAGGLGAAWRNCSPVRRAMTTFLVVQFAFAAQRAIGRSDIQHFSSLTPHAIVLLMLGLWTILKSGGLSDARRRQIALAAVAVSLALSPHGGVTPSEWLSAMRRAMTEPVPVLQRDEELAAKLGSDDMIWDVQNADTYLAYQRSNPTRHALAYCISSAAEQRIALADLQRRPPRFIFWRHATRTDLLERDIANSLRCYLIAPWVYRNYRPISATGRIVLEPASADWEGMDDVAERLGGPLELGWLGERWGAKRSSDVRIVERKAILLNRELNEPIRPRDWDYLLIEASAVGSTAARLEFRRPMGEWDQVSFIRWRLHGDGQRRRYLMPISCSPGWSWRKSIGALRCTAAEGSLTIHSAELWRTENEPR
jgi:hypothetical protein